MKKALKWTRQMRYRTYDEYPPDYLSELQDLQRQSLWRLGYHIQPTSGLLNDPNGFSYFNGQWHLFYQSFPYGAVHGLKSWQHLSSDDLIHWQDQGIGMLPDSPLDAQGVYSGSAIPVGDRLFIMYTGNVRRSDWRRDAYQLGAWMDQSGHIDKIGRSLIDVLPGYTDHFRDPQVFERDGRYWMILGAQTTNLKGRILLFRSDNLLDWEFVNEVNIGVEDLGYMVECPNLIFVQERPVMILCPQGLPQTEVAYRNIYPNMYVVADGFDFETGEMINPSRMRLLDHGLEIYATQVMQAPDQRALSIGWMGLPDLFAPSDIEHWAHNMSLIKELVIEDNHLYQRPIEGYRSLRQAHQPIDLTLSSERHRLPFAKTRQANYQFKLDRQAQVVLGIFAEGTKTAALEISINAVAGECIIERTAVGLRYENETGHERIVTGLYETANQLEFEVFVDRSTVEIFINQGAEVLSSQVFPLAEQGDVWIQGTGRLLGDYWAMATIDLN